MSAGRRTFLYSTALIGFLILLSSLLVVSREAIGLWSSGLGLSSLAVELVRGSTGWIAAGLVGLVLWAASWFPANRAARQLTLAGASERASASRKAFLYGGQLVTLAVGLSEARLMVAALLRRAVDLSPANLAPWPGGALAGATGAFIALLFWGYHRWVTVQDGDFGHESGRAANWRRAYLYLGAFAGFALVIGGMIGYLRGMLGLASNLLWNAIAANPASIPTAAWHESIIVSVTALVVGIPAAILIWNTASRIAAGEPPKEYGALSRVTLLHAGLVFGTVACLGSAAYLLWQGLLLITGGIADSSPGWPNLILALACLPVGLVTWVAFASSARRTVALSRAAPGALAVRRLAIYLLSAAALAAFWIGLTQLFRVILTGIADTAATGSFLPAQVRAVSSSPQERFSLGAALVLVGAPAWWGYWWPRQVLARRADPQGKDERISIVRKTYLYGIIAAGAVVLAFSLLASALQAARGSGANAVIGVFLGGLIPLFWLVVHMLVLRGDRRLDVFAGAKPPAPVAPVPDSTVADGPLDATSAGKARSYSREELPALAAATALAASGSAQMPVIVIDGGDGSLGAGLLTALRTAVPETPLWPLGLNPNAQAAMSAVFGDAPPPALPPNALAQAVAIVGPSDILVRGGLGGEVSAELAAGLSASTARLILLPPLDPRLRWVAAPEWPKERWIENAVIEVTNLL